MNIKVLVASAVAAFSSLPVIAQQAPAPCGLVPSARQLEWYNREMIAFFHLELGTDIILTGLATNILAAGSTVFLMFVLTGDKGSTSTLASPAMPNLPIPFVNQIPIVGTLLNGENGAGYNLLSYTAILLTPVVSVFLYKTRLGVHLRAAGESIAAISCATRSSRSMHAPRHGSPRRPSRPDGARPDARSTCGTAGRTTSWRSPWRSGFPAIH